MSEKKRNWFPIIVLLLLLGLFPVLSYWYMKKGFDYQVDARSELQVLGPGPALPDTTFFGDTLTGADLGKQVRLLGYFDPAAEAERSLSGKYLKEVREQFVEVPWFRMELLVPQTSEAALRDYRHELGKDGPADILFFYATPQSRAQVNAGLHLETACQPKMNQMVLADTNGVVVNTYDLSDGKQFVRMIEHIAIMRPPEKGKQEALFQREREF